MSASSARRRWVLLIGYLLLLFASELSLESSHLAPSASPGTGLQSCAGRLVSDPLGPGSATLTLCNIGNYAYAAYVKVGTPGYGLWLEVDTGSADTWFMNSECQSPSCALRRRFNMANSSRSLQRLHENFSLTFGKGVSAQGELIRDRLCLSKETCIDRILGSVKQIGQSGMHSDGVLGLGMDALSRFQARGKKSLSFLSDMGTKIAGVRSVFGLRLNRHTFSNGGDGGELTLGYVNRTGIPKALPLVHDNNGYWMIGLGGLEFRYCTDSGSPSCKNIELVPLVPASGATPKAILDTGSTYILSSSPKLRSELNRWLKQGWVEPSGDHLITNCKSLDSLPTLRFSFCSNQNCTQKHTFTLTPSQYTFQYTPLDLCQRRVGLQYIAGLPFLVLGTTFLSNFHTTFDDGERRVELTSLNAGGRDLRASELFKNATLGHRVRNAREAGLVDNLLVCAMTIVIAVLLTPFR